MRRQKESDQTTVSVWGDLDMATLPKLRRVLQRVRRDPPRQLRVDLTEVGFFGAGTLDLLAETARRLRSSGCRVVVRARSQQARLFRLGGLEYLVTEVDRRRSTRSQRGAPGS